MNTSADHQPIPPAATGTSVFVLRYADTAERGLPPILFANQQVAVESDGAWWWEFYLDAPAGAASCEPLCVLRIPQRDVEASAKYDCLESAIAVATASLDLTTTR